jgi:hypothetical protein
MTRVTSLTPPGTRVFHIVLMRGGTLIKVDGAGALVVYDSKPTEVAPATTSALQVLRDADQPPTHPAHNDTAPSSPTAVRPYDWRGNGAYNTGTLDGILRTLAIYANSLHEGCDMENWLIVRSVAGQLSLSVEQAYASIKPLSAAHAEEIATRKPLALRSQDETDNTKE